MLETKESSTSSAARTRSTPVPSSTDRLLADALEADDNLVARLDNTPARVHAFRDERDERDAKAKRMRARAAEHGASPRGPMATRPDHSR